MPEFPFANLDEIKTKLYGFANRFEVCHLYDSNEESSATGADTYELLLGIGINKKYANDSAILFNSIDKTTFWVFAYFEYPGKQDETVIPAYVFEPKVVVLIKRGNKNYEFINNGIDEKEFSQILAAFEQFDELIPDVLSIGPAFIPQTDREEYLLKVEQIRKDILHGKYCEMNYCIGFKSELKERNFLPYIFKLNSRTSAPFAAFVKNENVILMCSSPERFISGKGKHILSQPIKGTNMRLDGESNKPQLQALKESEKERAENVMIVDLVRNDLSKVCLPGTVKVDELFGAYAFRSVNHLISTVSGELREGITFMEIMEALFPMGSMTGAPKIEVMKHIDSYEHSPRGIYSGCLGYINPERNFDFNVLIRTLVFDRSKSEIVYKVGSAITYDSVAEEEYEECILKGKSLSKVLQRNE